MGFKEIPPRFQNIRIYDVSENDEGQISQYDCTDTGSYPLFSNENDQLKMDLASDSWHFLESKFQNEVTDFQDGLYKSEQVELKAWRVLGGLFRDEGVACIVSGTIGNEMVETFSRKFGGLLLSIDSNNRPTKSSKIEEDSMKNLEVVEDYYWRFVGGILRNEIIDLRNYDYSELISTNTRADMHFSSFLLLLKKQYRHEYMKLLNSKLPDNDNDIPILRKYLKIRSSETTDESILVQIEDFNLEHDHGRSKLPCNLIAKLLDKRDIDLKGYLCPQENQSDYFRACESPNPDVHIDLSARLDWRSVAGNYGNKCKFIDDGSLLSMDFGGIQRNYPLSFGYQQSQHVTKNANICVWRFANDEEKATTHDCNNNHNHALIENDRVDSISMPWKPTQTFNCNYDEHIVKFWSILGGTYENEVVDIAALKRSGGNERNECVDLSAFKTVEGLFQNETSDLGWFKFSGGLLRSEAPDIDAINSAEGIFRHESIDLSAFKTARGLLRNEAVDLSSFKSAGGLLRNEAPDLSAFKSAGGLSSFRSSRGIFGNDYGDLIGFRFSTGLQLVGEDNDRFDTVFESVNDDLKLEELVQKEYIDLSGYENGSELGDAHLELSDFESDFVYLSDCDYIPK